MTTPEGVHTHVCVDFVRWQFRRQQQEVVMPRTTSTPSKNGSDAKAPRVKPYFERLEPLEAAFANEDGTPTVHISVYDDRENIGQRKPGIVVQVKSLFVNDDGETRFGKTATMTLDAADRLGEIAEFLTEVQGNLS